MGFSYWLGYGIFSLLASVLNWVIYASLGHWVSLVSAIITAVACVIYLAIAYIEY